MKKQILFVVLLVSSFGYAQNEYLLAENYFRAGEYEKATTVYKKLYEKSPFNTTYLQRLISCYQETTQFVRAEELLKAKIQSNPSQVFLYVYLGYNYERQQQKETATIYYQKALSAIDEKSNYSGLIAAIFKHYSLIEYAITAYEKAMKNNPKANYNFQIAQLYGEKGAFKKMFQSYIDLIDKNPDYVKNVQRYVSRYLTNDAESKNNILFRKTLLRKSASNPKDEWNLLLSWLFAQQKEYGKAFLQERALYQRNSEDLSQIFLLGKIAFENTDYDSAKQIFSFVNENALFDEEKLEANLYLAKIAMKTKSNQTEELFQRLFSTFGKNQATIKLQVLYADYLTFQKNNASKAIEVLKNALGFSNSKFDKARIKLKLGEVLVFTGKKNKALIYFSQIQTQLKNHPLAQQATFKVAQTSYFNGDFTWAKAQLKILKSATTQLIANDAIALFLTITDNEPVDAIPSGLTAYAKADLLAFQNKNQEAVAVLKDILNKFKGQPIEDEALFKQATLFIKLQAFENAIVNFKKIIQGDPKGILRDDAHYALAELYNYQLNNPEKASEHYQKIIFDFASSIYLVDARKKYRKLRGDAL
ncbi:MAG: tetratricopeptide repeat protein [Polaribacter sp.]